MKHLRDQRGIGMILEILLVVAVLGLVGVAFYTYSSHKDTASAQPTPTPKSSASPSVTPTASADPTASWKAYSNAAGKFSLKYPASWVVNTCDDGVFMALSDAGLGKVGKCMQTDGWGHINIMARPLTDELAKQLVNIPAAEKVTVAGLPARRTVSIVESNTSPSYSPPAGTKEIAYIFKSGRHVYWALYVQEPTGASSTDLSADFDKLMQQTFAVE